MLRVPGVHQGRRTSGGGSALSPPLLQVWAVQGCAGRQLLRLSDWEVCLSLWLHGGWRRWGTVCSWLSCCRRRSPSAITVSFRSRKKSCGPWRLSTTQTASGATSVTRDWTASPSSWRTTPPTVWTATRRKHHTIMWGRQWDLHFSYKAKKCVRCGEAAVGGESPEETDLVCNGQTFHRRCYTCHDCHEDLYGKFVCADNSHIICFNCDVKRRSNWYEREYYVTFLVLHWESRHFY